MKNTILKQINALGARLGYPFVIYADGTYSKENVLEAKDVPVMAVVKKKMPAKSLNMDFLQGVYADDKNVLRYLSEVGENIGFPYYVYMDGTCGTTPVAAASKYPRFKKSLFAKLCQNQKSAYSKNRCRRTEIWQS